jgi:hypothetical protein
MSASDSVANECPICYEVVDVTKNNATTPCGHTFCFSCISQALVHNNECPCCRGTLQEEVWEDVEEEDEDEDGEEGEEEEGESENEQHVEIISQRFAALGYTMSDLITLLINRPSRLNPDRATQEFIEKMEQDFDTIVDDGDKELQESALFEEEDIRSATHVEKAVSGLLLLSQCAVAM